MHPLFTDPSDISHRFPRHVQEIGNLCRFHGLSCGSEADLPIAAARLLSSEAFRLDLSARARQIRDRERGQLTVSEIFTITAVGIGGTGVNTDDPSIGNSANLLLVLLTGVGGWHTPEEDEEPPEIAGFRGGRAPLRSSPATPKQPLPPELLNRLQTALTQLERESATIGSRIVDIDQRIHRIDSVEPPPQIDEPPRTLTQDRAPLFKSRRVEGTIAEPVKPGRVPEQSLAAIEVPPEAPPKTTAAANVQRVDSSRDTLPPSLPPAHTPPPIRGRNTQWPQPPRSPKATPPDAEPSSATGPARPAIPSTTRHGNPAVATAPPRPNDPEHEDPAPRLLPSAESDPAPLAQSAETSPAPKAVFSRLPLSVTITGSLLLLAAISLAGYRWLAVAHGVEPAHAPSNASPIAETAAPLLPDPVQTPPAAADAAATSRAMVDTPPQPRVAQTAAAARLPSTAPAASGPLASQTGPAPQASSSPAASSTPKSAASSSDVAQPSLVGLAENTVPSRVEPARFESPPSTSRAEALQPETAAPLARTAAPATSAANAKSPNLPSPGPGRSLQQPAGPLHISSAAVQDHLLFSERPIYPFQARSLGVQGTVTVAITVGTNGLIKSARSISGPVLLLNPAQEVVRSRRYRPYMVDGHPVEFQTEIAVHYALQQ